MNPKKNNMLTNNHIAILSTCEDDWGGSEELWALSIPFLQAKNCAITLVKDTINKKHPRIADLKAKNVKFKELTYKPPRGLGRFYNAFNMLTQQYHKLAFNNFEAFLKKTRPKLVVISQGINFDALYYGYLCLKHHIDYVIISQKAVEFYWPAKDDRDYMIETWKNAKKCFFVSKHNQNLTEEQFGFRFKNAHIIYNPNKLNHIKPIPYPKTENGYKMAIIGRLLIIDKGQDIILRVLSEEKWKKRNLRISIIGSGPDESALKDLTNLLEIKNIDFLGFKNNIEDIWHNHHALLLPSRSEGLPLVVIEAMAAGRPVIATHAGGTNEIIEDNKTGFIGFANHYSLNETLERAWSSRHTWEEMGIEAAKTIKNKLPNKPEQEFANIVIALMHHE